MTNASSTYLSIVIGAIVGGLITWWVYKIQKSTSSNQDKILQQIHDLEQSHETVLKSIQTFQQHQERLLNQILVLEDKIDNVLEANK